MASNLRRPSLPTSLPILRQQTRHASLLRRPKRPYTFTQMITLSDGSTFLHRTTSPQPIYRSTKDTKNNPLWNPSSQRLASVEEDEAGRLKRFRGRFGRGWDAEVLDEDSGEGRAGSNEGNNAQDKEDGQAKTGEESLMDLISSYGQDAAGVKEGKAKSGKGKGVEK